MQGTDSYGRSHRAQTAAGEGAEVVFTGLESPTGGSFPSFPLYLGVSPLPGESLHVHVCFFFWGGGVPCIYMYVYNTQKS